MKKIGLTLGKYAPLHKGHQMVIETALKEVDELIVIIYDTDVIKVPLSVRTKWIKTLYPEIIVIEAWDGPVGYAHEREYEIKEEQYILSLLNGIKITHFYGSEYYGEHMSKALGAIDRRIDEARITVPISATLIRKDPFKYRNYLEDVVYRDLITKAVFLGAMSTGKTTITEALAERYHTTCALEYGREYWATHQVNRRISFKAFNEIALGHIEKEELAFKNANKYCFVDTNAITTYMFSLDYHGEAPELLTKIADENYKRYDIFFLCDDDIPYDDTWDRSGNQKRKVFQKQIISDLLERKIPFILIQGDLESRMRRVEEVLEDFVHYSNHFAKSL